MARAAIRQIVIGVAASALLMGCVQGGNPFAAGPKPAADGSVAPAAAASPKGNRDVEAPEVFQVNETALWDGRPSLGGVWVASPDTNDPERVIMRNAANGQTVVGALFRRERDNPGPKLQISSDAAEALGLLAGQPAEISVTALRREEVAAPVVDPAAETVAEPAKDAAAKPATEASAIETTAIATAALDKVDGKPATDAAAMAAETPVAAPPVKETRKTRREKAAAAKAAAAAAAAAPLDATAAAGAAPDADAALPADPAATPEKPKTRKEKRAEAAAAKRAAAEAAAAPPAPTEAAPLPAPETPAPETAAPAPAASRPIQIGFFSEEANANRAVTALTKAGVPAAARKEESAGKVYWTVTARGDAATLKKAKAAGFADAYFLK